jgi:hypothetical protein
VIAFQEFLRLLQLNRWLCRYPHDYIKEQPMANFNMSQPPGRTYRYYTGFGSMVMVMVMVMVMGMGMGMGMGMVMVMIISIGKGLAAVICTRA